MTLLCCDGRTEGCTSSVLLDLRCWREDDTSGKSGYHSPSAGKILRLRPKEIRGSTLPRKFSKHKHNKTVPQTDTGGRVEKTKVNE